MYLHRNIFPYSSPFGLFFKSIIAYSLSEINIAISLSHQLNFTVFTINAWLNKKRGRYYKKYVTSISFSYFIWQMPKICGFSQFYRNIFTSAESSRKNLEYRAYEGTTISAPTAETIIQPIIVADQPRLSDMSAIPYVAVAAPT